MRDPSPCRAQVRMFSCFVLLKADITDDKEIYETCPDIDSTIRHFKCVAAARRSGINEGFRMRDHDTTRQLSIAGYRTGD